MACKKDSHDTFAVIVDGMRATSCKCGKLDEVLLDGSPVDFEKLDTRDPDMDSLQHDASELLSQAQEKAANS